MRRPEFWKPVIASLVLTPVFCLIGLASGGAGHGDFVLGRLLFAPALFAATVVPPLWFLFGIVQFPLYGLGLGLAAERPRFAFVPIVLLVLHLLLAAASFLPFAAEPYR